MEGAPNFKDKLNPGEMYPPDIGQLHLQLDTRELVNKDTGSKIELTSHEYQILWLLVRSKGSLITKDEIMEFLHEDDDGDLPDSDIISPQLYKIRGKLEAVAPGVFTLQSTRGHGLRLLEGQHPIREINRTKDTKPDQPN